MLFKILGDPITDNYLFAFGRDFLKKISHGGKFMPIASSSKKLLVRRNIHLLPQINIITASFSFLEKIYLPLFIAECYIFHKT
jgi:hypothetical protein